MKSLRSMLLAAGVLSSAFLLPSEVSHAWWWDGPGLWAWRHAYIYDPNYRWGPPELRSYIRDLYLYGPYYAQWRQARRYGWWW